ncbi:MAG: 3,4-dihydroxy-2-butanone-4-phosphate synthase [Acidilobaceae archaeon]
MEFLEKVVRAIRLGYPVMIYDDDNREAEVDLVYPAWAADPDVIYTLRVEAGGLICYVTESRVTSILGLPWGDEILMNYGKLALLASKRLRYGDRPAFTIWVNHINVRTGISDEDRSLTIRRLDDIVKLIHEGRIEEAKSIFYSEFQAPGHVPILAARDLRVRRGHTEISIALFKIAGLRPSLVLAEMLSRGKSMSLEEAKTIASSRSIPLVLGSDIIKWCMSSEVCWSS